MDNSFQQHLTRFAEIFKPFTLTTVLVDNSARVHVYLLRHPERGTYRAQLTFAPEGICIMGDVRFGNQSAAVCHGYGRDWFLGELEPGYLAGKFGFDIWSDDPGQVAACAMLAAVQQAFRRLLREEP